MFRFKGRTKNGATALLCSKLYNEQTFYPAFLADIQQATQSIIVESPFITYKRLKRLMPALQKASQRGVAITVNTRDPECHEITMQKQAGDGVSALKAIGATVLYTGNHHRKLAIVDRRILWEGSLNILSQTDSCEVMRRIDSVILTEDMIRFTGLERWYTE